jgi:hypothetical protein
MAYRFPSCDTHRIRVKRDMERKAAERRFSRKTTKAPEGALARSPPALADNIILGMSPNDMRVIFLPLAPAYSNFAGTAWRVGLKHECSVNAGT